MININYFNYFEFGGNYFKKKVPFKSLDAAKSKLNKGNKKTISVNCHRKSADEQETKYFCRFQVIEKNFNSRFGQNFETFYF